MNPHLQRAALLYDQSRFDLAEAELRQALAADPQNASAHSLLALCMADRQQWAFAEKAARHAAHLGPDLPFAFYALARVLSLRNRTRDAIDAIHDALRLDPADPDYHAFLGQLHLDQKQWADALAAAESGLRLDAENIACTNIRAIALVKLGRTTEAGQTIGAALARNPQDPLTHANQGWTLLEQGQPPKALEHFREALRLDPTLDWARQGIIEALKARHAIYALMLRYFLAMAKLSPATQWGIVLGGYFASRWLGSIAADHPALAPWVLPLRIAYVLFVLLSWTAQPLFNLLLRFHRFGRLALSKEQTTASNWLAACLGAAASFLILSAATGNFGFALAALVCGVLLIPVSGVFACPQGWPRQVARIFAVALALIGLAGAMLAARYAHLDAPSPPDMAPFALLGLFFPGCLVFMLLANFLIHQNPKR